LCISLGKISCFIWDKNSHIRRKTTKEETKLLVDEINAAIYKDNGALIYTHRWEPGDLVITDNLALGHMASANTQCTTDEVGLRVMHRTIVRGNYRPSKHYIPMCNHISDSS